MVTRTSSGPLARPTGSTGPETLAGPGSSAPAQEICTRNNPVGIHVVDLDGDGDLDVMSEYGSELAWSKNLGAGNFQVNIGIKIGFSGNPLVVGAVDFDDDGDPDAFTVTDDGNLRYSENKLNQPNPHSGARSKSPTAEVGSNSEAANAALDRFKASTLTVTGARTCSSPQARAARRVLKSRGTARAGPRGLNT